jgi:hypothetical protein
VIVVAILTGAAMLGHLSWAGRYYLLPLWERPDSALHPLLRPSGQVGHPFGWLGAGMILVGVMIYSSRKRLPFLQRRGPMRTWLNVHIYLCLAGPLLVTFHTALKLHGVAVYSYWSMMIVASSGIIGRWLYQQFPRTTRDKEMSIDDMRADQAEARSRLETEFKLPPAALAEVDALAARSVRGIRQGALALPALLLDDLARPFRLAALRRRLRAERRLPRREAHALIDLLRRRVAAERRIAFLGTFRRFFTYWHVTHLVFFVSMIAMLVLHVASVLFFGAAGNG